MKCKWSSCLRVNACCLKVLRLRADITYTIVIPLYIIWTATVSRTVFYDFHGSKRECVCFIEAFLYSLNFWNHTKHLCIFFFGSRLNLFAIIIFWCDNCDHLWLMVAGASAWRHKQATQDQGCSWTVFIDHDNCLSR